MISSRLPLVFSLLILLFAPTALAQAQDPTRAREHLRQGYELKTQGRYAEALGHLLESLRLDSQLKTIINVADCEEQLRRFTDARKHWLLARDNARFQGHEEFVREAELRLQALENRMPYLTITFSAPPPAGARVSLGSAALGDVSLGKPLPVDPGKHVILVQAPRHETRSFEVTLREGERFSVQVAPGPSQGTTSASDSDVVDAPQDRRRQVQRIAALGAAGVGLVGLGVATVSWLDASSTHDEALEHCDPTCNERARNLQSDAKSAARLGNVSAVVGGALIASGVALWLTAPAATPAHARAVRLVPVLAPHFGGVFAQGAFR